MTSTIISDTTFHCDHCTGFDFGLARMYGVGRIERHVPLAIPNIRIDLIRITTFPSASTFSLKLRPADYELRIG